MRARASLASRAEGGELDAEGTELGVLVGDGGATAGAEEDARAGRGCSRRSA